MLQLPIYIIFLLLGVIIMYETDILIYSFRKMINICEQINENIKEIKEELKENKSFFDEYKKSNIEIIKNIDRIYKLLKENFSDIETQEYILYETKNVSASSTIELARDIVNGDVIIDIVNFGAISTYTTDLKFTFYVNDKKVDGLNDVYALVDPLTRQIKIQRNGEIKVIVENTSSSTAYDVFVNIAGRIIL